MTSLITDNSNQTSLRTTGINLDRELQNPSLEKITFHGYSEHIESSFTWMLPDVLNPCAAKDPLVPLAGYVSTASKLHTLYFEYRSLKHASIMSQALLMNETIEELTIRLVPFYTHSLSLDIFQQGIEQLIDSINAHEKINALKFYTSSHFLKDELNELILDTMLTKLKAPSLITLQLNHLTDKMFFALSQAISRDRIIPEKLILEGRYPLDIGSDITDESFEMFALAWLTNSTVRHLSFNHFWMRSTWLSALSKSLSHHPTLATLEFDQCPHTLINSQNVIPLFPPCIELKIDGRSLRKARPILHTAHPLTQSTYGTFPFSSASTSSSP